MGTFQRGNPKDALNSQPKSVHREFPTEENSKQEGFAFGTGLGNQRYYFVGIQDFRLMWTYFQTSQNRGARLQQIGA